MDQQQTDEGRIKAGLWNALMNQEVEVNAEGRVTSISEEGLEALYRTVVSPGMPVPAQS